MVFSQGRQRQNVPMLLQKNDGNSLEQRQLFSQPPSPNESRHASSSFYCVVETLICHIRYVDVQRIRGLQKRTMPTLSFMLLFHEFPTWSGAAPSFCHTSLFAISPQSLPHQRLCGEHKGKILIWWNYPATHLPAVTLCWHPVWTPPTNSTVGLHSYQSFRKAVPHLSDCHSCKF